MNTALLLRVSTAAQADRETPLERQEAECRAFAAARGMTIAERFSDPGVPGRKDELSRAGLAALLAAADAGRIQAVVMWSWSRLARDEDLAGHLRWLLRRAGVTCHSVTEPDDHPLIRAVQSWKDAEYSRDLSRIGRSAKAMTAREGRKTSRDPFGYTWLDKRTLVPHPEQAPILRRMFEQTAAGASLREVCRDARIPKATAHRILRDRYALGEYTYGREAHHRQPITHLDHHEAIISRETWEAAQRVLDARACTGSLAKGRAAFSPVAYTGLLVCGECGGPMDLRGTFRRPDGTVRRYHRCRSGCAVHWHVTDGTVQLGALVLEELSRDGVAELVSALLTEAWESGRETGHLEAEIRRLERSERSITAAIESGDIADARTLARSLGEAQRRLQEARAALAKADVARPRDLSPGAIRAAFARILEGRSLSESDATELIREMVDRVEVRADGALVTFTTRAVAPLPEVSHGFRELGRGWQRKWAAA